MYPASSYCLQYFIQQLNFYFHADNKLNKLNQEIKQTTTTFLKSFISCRLQKEHSYTSIAD